MEFFLLYYYYNNVIANKSVNDFSFSSCLFLCSGRSPIYSHMNATLQGLSTVRVFNANKILENEFHEFQDQNTSSFFLFLCATRCFALWLDIVCLAYIAFVTYSFLFLGDGKQLNSIENVGFRSIGQWPYINNIHHFFFIN